MRVNAETISLLALAGCLAVGTSGRARAQTPVRSTVVIPLKKEKAPLSKVITIHDTVTMVRVDTVRIVETVVRTDTIFSVDTLRDSCSRAAVPIPIPIPLPIDHRHEEPTTPTPTTITAVAPEPETFVLVGTGLATLIGFARYRRRK